MRVKLRKSSQTVYKTRYHIVWITWYRKKILAIEVRDYFRIKFQEILKYDPDWEYIEIAIKEDHVQLVMVIPPKYAVSMVVETIKKNTSKTLKKKFAFLKKVYWDNEGSWEKGYFVSTVGINEAIIRK